MKTEQSQKYAAAPFLHEKRTACILLFRSSTNLRERYGEGAHFLSIFNRFWRHVRQNRAFSQSVATENASPFRSPPGNPEGFQGIGPSHQKRYFFDGLRRCSLKVAPPAFALFSLSFFRICVFFVPLPWRIRFRRWLY